MAPASAILWCLLWTIFILLGTWEFIGKQFKSGLIQRRSPSLSPSAHPMQISRCCLLIELGTGGRCQNWSDFQNAGILTPNIPQWKAYVLFSTVHYWSSIRAEAMLWYDESDILRPLNYFLVRYSMTLCKVTASTAIVGLSSPWDTLSVQLTHINQALTAARGHPYYAN